MNSSGAKYFNTYFILQIYMLSCLFKHVNRVRHKKAYFFTRKLKMIPGFFLSRGQSDANFALKLILH